jgi:hypothetical protein
MLGICVHPRAATTAPERSYLSLDTFGPGEPASGPKLGYEDGNLVIEPSVNFRLPALPLELGGHLTQRFTQLRIPSGPRVQ